MTDAGQSTRTTAVDIAGTDSPPDRSRHPDERGVFIELWVLDLAAGDYPTAILLSQLLWWHQPGRDGLPKLTHVRDGFRWLLKPDEWWFGECRLTIKQVRRVRKLLVDSGLVTCRRFKLNDAPTTAWRPNYEVIQEVRDTKCPISELPSQGQFQGSALPGAVPSSSPTKASTGKTTPSRAKAQSSFDAWWSLYPKKTAPGYARAAFATALRKVGGDAGILIDAAKRYASDPNLPEPKYIPEPARWLKAERWLDGPLPPRNGNGRSHVIPNRDNVIKDRDFATHAIDLD